MTETPDAVAVPENLRRELGATADGKAWLGRLPALVDAARTRWGLRLGEPFPSGVAGWTAPATTRDGEDAVVKIVFPHEEAAGEPAALALWSGRGGAELLDHDTDARTLLLRRVRPGHALEEDRPLLEAGPAGRLGVAAELLARLHGVSPADVKIPELAAYAARTVHLMTERAARFGPRLGADAGLLAEATALWAELPGSAGSAVVVHGDLNPGNILADDAAAARAWVAIDPKPVLGDPAFDPWQMLSQIGDPLREESPTSVLRSRLRLVAATAGLDAGRVAAWAMARAAESALWRADEQGNRTGALEDLEQARVWSRLAV